MPNSVIGVTTQGFDQDVPWQMVPLNETRVVTVMGPHKKATAEHPSIVKVTGAAATSAMSYSLTGLSPGKTNLLVDGKPLLEIEVFPAITRNIAFLFVDVVDRHPGPGRPYMVKRCPAEVQEADTWLATANGIYQKQANLVLNKDIAQRLPLPYDYGDKFFTVDGPKGTRYSNDEAQVMKKYLRPGATTVFVVNDVEVSAGDMALAAAFMNGYIALEITVESWVSNRGQILAHELGHVLGLNHRDQFDNLMYASANYQTRLTRDQIRILRNPGPKHKAKSACRAGVRT